MSDISDWDAVPVKASASTKPKVAASSAAANSSSNTADWDAVPVAVSGAPADSTKPKSNGVQAKERLLGAGSKMVDDIKSGNLAAPGIGLGEAALNVVSGLGSSAVGGLAGMARIPYEMARGESFSKAGDLGSQTMEKIQKAGTYQPRTGGGQFLSEVVATPGNALREMGTSAGGDVGQAVAGDQGRVMGAKVGGLIPDVAGVAMGGAGALKAVRPTPIPLKPMPAAAPIPVVSDVPAYVRKAQADFEAAKANGQAGANPTTPAGVTQANPAALVQAATPKAAPDFSAAEKLTPGDSPVNLNDQSARAAILQRVGIENVRKSALEGNAMKGATEAQMAKFNEPAGRAAKDVFDAERSALDAHGQSILAETGGTHGINERALNNRGQIISQPFDALREHFDTKIRDLYKQADEKSGGTPSTNLDEFNNLIKTESQFAGKAENGSLGKGIKSYLREQNIMDSDGNITPITVQQAEGIKQYINSQWSPSTSGLAGKIKATIDNDVFKSAGEDVYKPARDLFKLKKQTLDNPKGVSKLMDFDPQTPINRTTPYQKLPDAMQNLSPDQFKHLVDTLKQMPPELQPSAQAALAEIKGHMVNSVLEVGNKYKSKWNAKGVTEELKANSAKLPMVFTDAELAKLSDLNAAGHILSVDQSYPGAAAQAANAAKQGMMTHMVGSGITALGTTIGGVLGGPGAVAGSFAGRLAGNKAAGSLGERGALKKFNKGMVNLSDLPKDSGKAN